MVGCQGFGGDTGGTGRILLLDLREAVTQAFASLHGRSEFSVIPWGGSFSTPDTYRLEKVLFIL